MKIEQRKTDELIPYARNARTHSNEQVAQIAASIKEFGFNNPILVDGENGIIAGHGRLLAAMKLGLETVPVIELKHMSDTQRRAYILADNKIALNAGWDEELLNLELSDLSDLDFDLTLTGFDDFGIEDKESITLNDEDEIKENYMIVIECFSEIEQVELLERFQKEGLKCKALIS